MGSDDEHAREREMSLEHEVLEAVNRTMRSIGQDIHDDICQRLIALSMLSAAHERDLAGAGDEAIESAREMRRLIDDAADRSRRLAAALYPPPLEEGGLAPALEALAASAKGGAAAAAVYFQAEGECGALDEERALQLYRIIQEALTNALRHSGSDQIILRLVSGGGTIRAELRDFGRGFAPDRDGSGMGMRIMRGRADSIGARLEVSELENGVRVSCSVPIREDAR